MNSNQNKNINASNYMSDNITYSTIANINSFNATFTDEEPKYKTPRANEKLEPEFQTNSTSQNSQGSKKNSNSSKSKDTGNSDSINSLSPNSKKKKPFVERIGDWVCLKCRNLNFSFRVACNRCKLSKIESEMLFEQYMKNLILQLKFKEMLQNQVVYNNAYYQNLYNTQYSKFFPGSQIPPKFNIFSTNNSNIMSGSSNNGSNELNIIFENENSKEF